MMPDPLGPINQPTDHELAMSVVVRSMTAKIKNYLRDEFGARPKQADRAMLHILTLWKGCVADVTEHTDLNVN